MQRNCTENTSLSGTSQGDPPLYVAAPSRGSVRNMMNLNGGGGGGGGPNARYKYVGPGERLGWTAADMEQINTGASNLNKSTAPRPAMDIGGGPLGPMDGMGMGMGPMGPIGGGGGGMGMGGGMNDPMGGLGGMGGMPSLPRPPRRPRRPRMRPDAYGADADLGLDEGLGGLGDARGFGPPDEFEGGPGLGGLGLDDDGFGGGFGRGRRPGGGRMGKRGKGKGLGGRPPRRGREGPEFEDYAPPEMSGGLGRGANDEDAWEEG
ncbi:hypothetical protein EG327_002026 [Venturia inaequalis]|uniref:Uncharacterized protein n=1 Tax=Venturia inaequalis TaxID=5025 RepID=A0A8H3ZJB8_VENIN|nr:hypothetical protein EG327_002026 [Venturia inaequalis]